MLYVAWKRGLSQKFARFALFHPIKKRSYNLLCVLDTQSRFKISHPLLSSKIVSFHNTPSPFCSPYTQRKKHLTQDVRALYPSVRVWPQVVLVSGLSWCTAMAAGYVRWVLIASQISNLVLPSSSRLQ